MRLQQLIIPVLFASLLVSGASSTVFADDSQGGPNCIMKSGGYGELVGEKFTAENRADCEEKGGRWIGDGKPDGGSRSTSNHGSQSSQTTGHTSSNQQSNDDNKTTLRQDNADRRHHH